MKKFLLFLLLLLPLSPASGQGILNAGLVGQYQSGIEFVSSPQFTRSDVRLDFNWNSVGPGGSNSPSVNTSSWTTWSADWQGQIVSKTTEPYTWQITTSDTYSFLWRVHGTTNWSVVNINCNNIGINHTDKKVLNMIAGQIYDVKIDYWQHSNAGNFQIQWGSPTIPMGDLDIATPVGINEVTALDHDPGNLFADIVKMTGSLSGSGFSGTVDSNGWPTTDTTLTMWAAGGVELNGTYAFTFTGQASSIVDNSGNGTISGQTYNSGTNTTTFSLAETSSTPPDSVTISFTGTKRTSGSSTNTGFTNMSAMRPIAPGSTTSHNFGELLNVQQKSFLANFTLIRFMDYSATNSNLQVNWADRLLPSYASQFFARSGYGFQGIGSSWEYLIEMANETGKDVWINIPAEVTDTYRTDLANLFLYGSDGTNPYTSVQTSPVYPPLNSNLKLYIEYSNELWNNSLGSQYTYNNNQATTDAGLTNAPINYDACTTSCSTIWPHRRTCQQLVQISNDFRAVWGSQFMTRARPIYMWDYGYTASVATDCLHFMLGYYEDVSFTSTHNCVGDSNCPAGFQPPNYYFYGGGAGWYTYATSDSCGTEACIWASGINGIQTGTDSAICTGYGLYLCLGYEGGYTVGFSQPINATEWAASTDPGCIPLEVASLNQYFNAGGQYPVIFNAAGPVNSSYGVASPTINEQNLCKTVGVQQVTALPPP